MGETEEETMSNGTMEGALDSVSSQVSEAFDRLTRLQEELRARLQTVTERERTAEETTRALDELAKHLEGREKDLQETDARLDARRGELDQRHAEIEDAHRQREARFAERETALLERETKCEKIEVDCKERSASLDERESRLSRRQDVVDAFQEMLAQMHNALDTLAPDNIITALDAGAAYEDCVKNSRDAEGGSRSDTEEPPAKDPIALTPQEQARFFAQRDSGKSDAEILAEIYEARTAARNGAAA